MGYPEKAFDGPSHQQTSYRINQTNDGHRGHRTDVLRINRRNDMGEQEAGQGDILSEISLVSSSATHDQYIIVKPAFVPLQSEQRRVQLQ